MNANNIPVTLDLKLIEVNAVLAALGRLPFADVEPLVNKVRATAVEAIKRAEGTHDDQPAG